MADRCEQLLDAISLLGDRGVRAVTHRAVDAQAGLPVGSTSNHFRTRDALFDGIAERFSARERANWEHLAGRLSPTTPAELATAASAFAVDATRTHRTLNPGQVHAADRECAPALGASNWARRVPG